MKIIAKIWWMPLLIYMIIIPSFMSARMDSVPCRKIEINIADSLSYRFVTRERLFNMVQNDKRNLLGDKSGKIETEAIERDISGVKELERAEVYHTIDGVLHVDADQRDPLLRIITRYGNSYFIDDHGVIIPHSRVFTPRVTVVSGYIDIPAENLSRGNIASMDDKSVVKRIVKMVSYIRSDPFWSGQIEQIWINPDQELEIVPRVGNHIIKFGVTDDFESKLNHLETFYMTALPRMGWDSYREINLRYQGQIICKRR